MASFQWLVERLRTWNVRSNTDQKARVVRAAAQWPTAQDPIGPTDKQHQTEHKKPYTCQYQYSHHTCRRNAASPRFCDSNRASWMGTYAFWGQGTGERVKQQWAVHATHGEKARHARQIHSAVVIGTLMCDDCSLAVIQGQTQLAWENMVVTTGGYRGAGSPHHHPEHSRTRVQSGSASCRRRTA